MAVCRRSGGDLALASFVGEKSVVPYRQCRVRTLNSFVFSLSTTVRGIGDSLRDADQSFCQSPDHRFSFS